MSDSTSLGSGSPDQAGSITAGTADGGGAAAAAGRGAALARHPSDGWKLALPWPMGRSTRAAFRALIRALLPPPPAPQPGGIGDRVEESVRRLMRYMQPWTARLLVLVIHLLDWSPLWTFRGVRRLRRLSAQRAGAVLTALANSRITLLRQLVVAARGAVLSTYFDDEEVHRAMGYAPVPFMRDRIALRARLRQAGATQAGGRVRTTAGVA